MVRALGKAVSDGLSDSELLQVAWLLDTNHSLKTDEAELKKIQHAITSLARKHAKKQLIRLNTQQTLHYNDAACGTGKTHWMLDKIATTSGRYVVAVPKTLDLDEKRQELESRGAGVTCQQVSARDNNAVSVRTKIARAIDELSQEEHCCLFVTHKALFMNDWSACEGWQLFIDECPENLIEIPAKYDFRRSANGLKRVFLTSSINDYYYQLIANASFTPAWDDSAGRDKDLLHDITRYGRCLYVSKSDWDNLETTKAEIYKVYSPEIVKPFASVCLLGDSFTDSEVYTLWTKLYSVSFLPVTDFSPRQRAVPMSQRVVVSYVAEKATATKGYFSRNPSAHDLLCQFAGELREKRGVVPLFTTNSDYDALNSLLLLSEQGDVTKLSPKTTGSNLYSNATVAMWFAAMKQNPNEARVKRDVLGISQEEMTTNREYYAMWQFLMRSKLRDTDSGELCYFYVFDRAQAEYVAKRCGIEPSAIQFEDIGLPDHDKEVKAGRPKTGKAKSSAERKRQSRLKRRAEGELPLSLDF